MGRIKSWYRCKKLLKEALQENVTFVPRQSFLPNGGKPNYFRLNYSNSSEEKIVKGIKRLGKVLNKYYDIA